MAVVKKKKAAKTTAAAKAKAGAHKKAAAKKKAAKGAAKTARIKSVRKTAAKKTPAKRMAPRPERELIKIPPLVEPGPPAGSVPPVEEPTLREEAVGVVTHYYSHLGVAVVQVNKGEIKAGDRVRIKGHTTDLTQIVGSMEYEHEHVERAGAGAIVGIKVMDHVRGHDIVYRVR